MKDFMKVFSSEENILLLKIVGCIFVVFLIFGSVFG